MTKQEFETPKTSEDIPCVFCRKPIIRAGGMNWAHRDSGLMACATRYAAPDFFNSRVRS